MSSLLSLTNHGVAKYVASIPPTASIVGAQLDDLYVDSATGINYRCIDATFGFQQWLGSDGNTVPSLITSFSHPDLVAAYTMDNISGSTLVDESPNGNDGTIVEAVAVAGKIGNALDFDGTNDRVDTSIPNTGGVSVSFWINQDTLVRQYLFSDYDSGGSASVSRISLALGATYWEMSVGNDTIPSANNLFDNTSFAHSLTTGTWFHIVYILSGTNAYIYRNATLDHTIPLGFTVRTDAAGGSWRLATTGDALSLYANTKMDQFRRFNRALTQAEIDTLYNSGAGA